MRRPRNRNTMTGRRGRRTTRTREPRLDNRPPPPFVGDGSVSRTHHLPLMRRLLTPLSYPAMWGAPTRSRTSRPRHRKPVLCPAELWTHRLRMWKPRQGSNLLPPGSKPGALSGMSYGAIRRIRGWPGRDRTGRLPPCREGALPLSYRPEAAAPGFEPDHSS